MSLVLPDPEEHADRSDPWLLAIEAARPFMHEAAWGNCIKAATARARLAYMRREDGQRVSQATATALGAKVGLARQGVLRGTKTLLEHGLLTVAVPATGNTPAVYVLTVPEHIAHRRDWQPLKHALPDIQLTVEQKSLEQALFEFLAFGVHPEGSESPENVFLLHGYAGTGKTLSVVTILSRMEGIDFDRVLFLAPTNKAASVLRGLGVAAKTVKSALYMPMNDAAAGELRFLKNYASDVPLYDVVVVDEASMCSEEEALWIESQAKRVVVIGDPAQLRPVRGLPYWTADGRKPDFTLTEVQRAENQRLRDLGISVRTDQSTLADIDDPEFRIGRDDTVDPRDYDVVIVETNAHRLAINGAVRGFGPPSPGDVIQILENRNMNEGDGPDSFYNGQTLTIDAVLKTASQAGSGKARGFTYHWIKASETVGDVTRTRYLYILDDYLLRQPANKPEWWEEVAPGATLRGKKAPVLRATYANSITVHKSQGSGYPKVLVVDPAGRPSDEASRSAYTAITRGRTVLHIANLHQIQGLEE